MQTPANRENINGATDNQYQCGIHDQSMLSYTAGGRLENEYQMSTKITKRDMQ